MAAEKNTEETVFSGVREKWFPLYRELKRMTEKALGGFEVRAAGAAVLWRHYTSFAELGAKKGCLTISFASDSPHEEWEPVKIVQTSKNRVVHYFEAAGGEDFPVFVERIGAAYALTKPAKPPKQGTGNKGGYNTIDEYIALFPLPQSGIMQKVRETIHQAAPEAVEKISWQMPTFYQNGNLIHFSAAKAHLGIYPGSGVVEAFGEKLGAYKTSKGAIQFPWGKPMPYGLIAEITRFCVGRNMERVVQ